MWSAAPFAVSNRYPECLMQVVTPVIEVDLIDKNLEVFRRRNPDDHSQDTYDVVVNGEVKHPNCQAEDAMRALGQYIHNLSHTIKKERADKEPGYQGWTRK